MSIGAIILLAILVLIGLAIRYVIRNIAAKSSDAIINKIKDSQNKKTEGQSERLADQFKDN